MESNNIELPARSIDWVRRYVIGVPLIAFCHYVGSIFWLGGGFLLFWTDNSKSLLIEIPNVYFFPIGLNKMGSANSYIYLSIINAVFWGICIMELWYLIWSVLRKL